MTTVAFADMKTENLRIYKDTSLKDAMTAEWERKQEEESDRFDEPYEAPEMDCS